MKIPTLALSALLLAGSLGASTFAIAATDLTAKDGMTVYVFDKGIVPRFVELGGMSVAG